ncbi:PQQ-dependent sugar dehydrogenase [Paraflavitalea sp. CAU 1676]|uniref:CBM96 family carbohydrate-binding protein n=1 Tax=Paraflavitalea sp. CAU 1676 TaxID=3032598 RepID=UPI0023D9AADE|nr:PQQ-dependent sugar dehydrogenase [Paraflavitalea sp. CAU 1676]MDF2188176.1 PQQ-dependent sugar dehydrogenase [Paraflavitalea sp. CAU 1676]
MKKIFHLNKMWQLLLCCCLILFHQKSIAQTLPTNFQRVLVTGSLTNSTAMAFTPDGRALVCQQNGQLRVVKNGSLLSTPAVTLSVNTSGERGLIGVAVDPNFATNQYIYLYYTHTSGPHNRLSRFTMSGDVAGSELALLDFPTLVGIYHNGGGLAFGNDGKLYVAIGENQVGSNSQNLDTYLGKLLRINSDGTAAAGNPFSGNAVRSRIWAYGLRNPFTIASDPVSGKIYVNDVGNATWEEINDATTSGKNFGWPDKEGMCTSGCTGYTNPIYVYATNRTDPPPAGQGCAVNGGTFFNGAISNWPAVYGGKYFFLDYCGSWVDYINPSSPSRVSFGTSLGGGMVYLKQGTDGNLYFLNRDNSSLYRIVYTGNQAPTITAQPQNVSVPVGGTATFTVSATGSPAPTYQWRKGTTNIAGATANSYTITNVQASQAGQYNVVVSNSAGSVTSSNATLAVTQPNTLPVATINTPANGALFRSGNVISFSGSATDAEDGTVPAATFEWWVDFHHATHVHPGPQLTDGTSSGSFTADLSGHNETNIWYRIYLAVQDSQGGRDTTYVEIFPVTSNLTLQTQPAGLQVRLDAVPFTAPYTTEAISGASRPIVAISPQTLNGVTYIFDHWSQGGAAAQNIVITDNDVTYTAHYRVAPPPINLMPTHDAYVRDGTNASITHGTTDSTLLITKVSPAGQLNNARESYLLFDLASIAGNISSVSLKVYGKVDLTTVPSVLVGVYPVANTTWNENTLTWNNKPAAGTTELANNTVTNTAYQYINWDVTNYVKSELLAGRTKVSFLMKSLVAHDPRVFWNSSEFGSNPPLLSVIADGGNVPPTVSITAPANNASFTAPASITINATAADSDGTVTGVEFFNGTTSLGVDNTAPYSLTWNNVPVGTYTITARATDDSSAVTTSAPVAVIVQAAPSCTPVTASGDDGNVPANVLDNNLSTRWSANGDGQWIQLCLDDTVNVTGVQIAFHNGNTRTSTFDVLVGNNGTTWTTAAAGRVSSGTSLNLETFTFATQSGKYVRIVGHGNSVNLWNSYTEIKVQTSQGSQQFTLAPAHDAYVRNGTSADITHGTTDATILISKLNSNPAAGNDRQTYLRFDASGVSGAVSSAVVRIYGKLDDNRNTNVPVNAVAVSNTTWTESAITWNNKPATGAILSSATVTDSIARYYTWDITSYVQAELAAGRTQISLALLSTIATSPRITWNSKETGSNAPQLVITAGTQLLAGGTTTGLSIGDVSATAGGMKLNSYPNPFGASSTIRFSLERGGTTRLAVYDLQGREVSLLLQHNLAAGDHTVRFEPGQLASGVYVLRLMQSGKSVTKKLLKE